MYFSWKYVYRLESVNEMFMSPSVWMMPVDTSVEWTQSEIWG